MVLLWMIILLIVSFLDKKYEFDRTNMKQFSKKSSNNEIKTRIK